MHPCSSTHQGGFLLVLGNVCIFMETKHLWIGSDGKALHVVHVALVLSMLGGIVHATWGEPVQEGGDWMGLERYKGVEGG